MRLDGRIAIVTGTSPNIGGGIAEGLANAEKSKAELARAEAQRLEVLSQANAQATRLIEEARSAAFSAVDLVVCVLVELAWHQYRPPCMPMRTVMAMHLTDSWSKRTTHRARAENA